MTVLILSKIPSCDVFRDDKTFRPVFVPKKIVAYIKSKPRDKTNRSLVLQQQEFIKISACYIILLNTMGSK